MMTQDIVQLNEAVRIERHDGIGVLVIDNPPVNASSAAVRAGLIEGVETLDADQDVNAMVLIGADKNFISGSDLKEFSLTAIPKPELPEVIDAIRVSSKPVVAALSGATLGGGLELALGCDYRIASQDTIVGLPETTLGMIPGAGGTQRTLRLLGPAKTIDLATSGRRFTITDEHGTGLVDEVTATDLRTAAVEFAQRVTTKRDLLQEPVPAFDEGSLEHAATTAIGSSRGRPQIIAAVGAVLAGVSLPPEQGMLHERREFTRLRNGHESEALRHIFFAQRTALRTNRPSGEAKLTTVGIVGSGTMGRGIARAFADSGVNVIVHDQNAAALAQAEASVTEAYQKQADRGRLSQTDAQTRVQRIRYTNQFAGLAGADLYIEAVFEDLKVKAEVLTKLEQIADGAVIATNTSYLDIEVLADALVGPDRFLGLHFFSPAHRTPLVEVVYGRRTEAQTLDMACTAAKALGKVAIRSAVGEGFVGNRIFNAYRRQSELLLEEGALPAQVDAAMRKFGFAMGPFAVADMSGLDIAWRMRQRTAATRDPAARYPDVADQLCELGRFGQKTSLGWYRYGADGRTPLPDPEVDELIRQSSQRKGITRRKFTDEAIAARMVLAMANEAALVIADGIADRASDIDVMMVRAYGFPDFRGGPTCWARQQDPAQLAAALDDLATVTGAGFRKGKLELLEA